MSEYTEKAEQFLKAHGLEFRSVLVGSDCPQFCTDAEKDIDMDKLDTFPRKTHIHGKHYRCTVSGKDRGHVSFDFWNSYADEEQNYACSNGRNMPALCYDYKLCDKYRGKKRTQVTAYDLLACLTKYDPGTFENFCSDFGYNTDSRKAESTYHAVQKEYQKVSRFFTDAELVELQDIQ